MARLLSHKYAIWVLLALPLPWMVYYQLYVTEQYGFFFYWTGALSGIFAIASLAITPLNMLFPKAPWRLWVTRQRRYLGLAAFGYALAHVAYWLTKTTIMGLIESFIDPVLAIGWISVFIFAALAITSNNWSVRKLGPNWKKLQRWTYLGTFLGLVHWFWALKFPLEDTLIYGGVFIVLMMFRLAYLRPKTT